MFPRAGAGNKGLRKLVLSGNRIGGVIAFARALRDVMTRSESPLEVRCSLMLLASHGRFRRCQFPCKTVWRVSRLLQSMAVPQTMQVISISTRRFRFFNVAVAVLDILASKGNCLLSP